MRARHPFTIEAAVILPDHLHMIWTLPAEDTDFALRWRLIKSACSYRLLGGERISASRAAKRERGIWQRRYWEHTLRDDDDFERHLVTSISTQSNTVMRSARRIGRTPLFAAGFRLDAYTMAWAGDPGEAARPFGEK